jgi:hypothetical protein
MPKKTRILTEALTEMAGMPVRWGDLLIPASHFLSIQMWTAVLYGVMPLPGGGALTLTEQTRARLQQWMYSQVEGPPLQLPFGNDIAGPAEELTDEELNEILIRAANRSASR